MGKSPKNKNEHKMIPESVLSYWLDELGPEGWYAGTPEIDQSVRSRFGEAWDEAASGGLMHWLTNPTECLAYIILTDQMPRNMFRGTARAFASDMLARSAADIALTRGWDLRIRGAERQFFYLPLVHSESLSDQERAVRLMSLRLKDDSNLLHARAHREVIRMFGRFPTRNADLQRRSTLAEEEWLGSGGYMQVVNGLKAA